LDPKRTRDVQDLIERDESRLALRSAEVRDLRGELEQTRELPREVVRIGGARGHDALDAPPDIVTEDDAPLARVPEEPRDDDRGPRPVLRLYGAPRPAGVVAGVTALPGSQAPAIVPPPPQVAFGPLPPMITPDVPAIPEHPIVVGSAPIARTPMPRAPEDDAIVREYQSALAHVEARRWELALASLTRFVAAHPDHPYADNAMYWQGEVHYARREYRRAIDIFGALAERYPRGNKVPDALLRIGLSLEHLGDRDGARAYFRRVREQYPDSIAARMASREET
ncbi:MAG: tol-pal system protein YbgF, partial [Myxococcota bacterium]|nr:tol-pal system protein YbgF [Myxococcota bacterium]